MKFDQRGKQVYFRAGSAFGLLWSAHQRGYLDKSRADSKNFGKVGYLAKSESMGLIILMPMRH